MRKQGTMAQDDVHGNREDIRFQPPPEFQGKWEAFKNRTVESVRPEARGNAQPLAGQ